MKPSSILIHLFLALILLSCGKKRHRLTVESDSVDKYKALGYQPVYAYDSIKDSSFIRFVPKKDGPDSVRFTNSSLNPGSVSRFHFEKNKWRKVALINPDWNTEEWSVTLASDSIISGDTLLIAINKKASDKYLLHITDSASYTWVSKPPGFPFGVSYCVYLVPKESGKVMGWYMNDERLVNFQFNYCVLDSSSQSQIMR